MVVRAHPERDSGVSSVAKRAGDRRDWETFPHGSDVGVRGFGSTPAQAFEAAGRALTAVVTDLETVRALEPVEIACEAPDLELLLLDWLNALVYEMAVGRRLFARFEVELDGTRLHGRAFGEQVDRLRHDPRVEVKGATPSELSVAREPDGRWRAQCIVDV
jgi:SHS2 domain-containing protein